MPEPCSACCPTPRGSRMARRALLLAPTLALITALGLLAVDRETGLSSLHRLSRDVAAARARVAELARERAELLDRVRRLRADPFMIEAVAREQLGMVRPGEVVIHWDAATPPAHAPREVAAGRD